MKDTQPRWSMTSSAGQVQHRTSAAPLSSTVHHPHRSGSERADRGTDFLGRRGLSAERGKVVRHAGQVLVGSLGDSWASRTQLGNSWSTTDCGALSSRALLQTARIMSLRCLCGSPVAGPSRLAFASPTTLSRALPTTFSRGLRFEQPAGRRKPVRVRALRPASYSPDQPLFRITQLRSAKSLHPHVQRVIDALGLKRGRTTHKPAVPKWAGAILKVKELLHVENVTGADFTREMRERSGRAQREKGYEVLGRANEVAL